MANWILPCVVVEWISALGSMLDARVGWRLLPLLTGVLFADGRRTVSRWLVAAGLGKDFRRYYYFLGTLGRKAEFVAQVLVRLVVRVIPLEHLGEYVVLALDDTPTKRYGPQVQGAGVHHNPTPGPAGSEFLYGHVWVTLSWVVRHPVWGAIGLPLRSLMYIRQCDLPQLDPASRPAFATKLELAVQLVAWVLPLLKSLGKKVLVVADGAFAMRNFLKPAQELCVVVVSRLRKDAALFDLPKPPQTKNGKKPRGRPRKYGTKRISLAKRAAHRGGWQTGEFLLYGEKVVKTYKTFLATYPPAGGVIRVVIVKEDHGWVAWLCTDAEVTVETILGAVSDRAAIEQNFHDVKEVHGAGEQQLRDVHANIGAWHVTLWLHTLIELWAWGQSHAALTDRTARPWDDATRRPSHADRRNALRRACLRHTFSTLELPARGARKIRAVFNRLLQLVA